MFKILAFWITPYNQGSKPIHFHSRLCIMLPPAKKSSLSSHPIGANTNAAAAATAMDVSDDDDKIQIAVAAPETPNANANDSIIHGEHTRTINDMSNNLTIQEFWDFLTTKVSCERGSAARNSGTRQGLRLFHSPSSKSIMCRSTKLW